MLYSKINTEIISKLFINNLCVCVFVCMAEKSECSAGNRWMMGGGERGWGEFT